MSGTEEESRDKLAARGQRERRGGQDAAHRGGQDAAHHGGQDAAHHGGRSGGQGEPDPEDATVRLLLVDDRPENLLALEAVLDPLGHELVTARSGEEALKLVLRYDFAVILMDVQMPGMNGFETAELIKKRERSRTVPIIFLTAISKDEEYVFQGYSVGAVDYMFKPLQSEILRSKVSVFVDLYRKQLKIQRQAELLRRSDRRELEYRHMMDLWESEARASEIMKTATEAIVTFGEDGEVALFNGAAERMFGRSAADVRGRPADELFGGGLSGQLLSRARATCTRRDGSRGEGERPAGVSLTGVRADGAEFPAEVSLSCLELPDGAVYTVIARDITERHRAEEALRRQAEALTTSAEQLRKLNEELREGQAELEQAITARSRFYASMSHELRTPINAVLGYSSLLMDGVYGELTEEQRSAVERAQRAARHLIELVNDVLDLSKIEAGKLELQVEPVEFPALVQDLFVTMTPLADEHGSPLTLEGMEEQSRILHTDGRRVRQILLNLLSNAIKFGEGKAIQVRCAPLPDGGVEVAVCDRGAGISLVDQARIFNEFVQLEEATPAQQGTGLGLPISRRLADLLGGQLEVDSTQGEGSTFTLRLPARSPFFDVGSAEVREAVMADLNTAGERADSRRGGG